LTTARSTRKAPTINKEIVELRDEIHRHEELYYVNDNPEISDSEYDALLARLQELEAKHPKLITPDSPTQRVGGRPAEGFPEVVHRRPMLSLENTYNIEELIAFDQRCQRLAEGRPRLTGTSQSRRAVAERFAHAFATGDGSALSTLLATDVGMWSDGGGKVSAARRPLTGRDEVLKFLVGLQRTAATAGLIRNASLAIEDVNSEPALVLRIAQRLESVFVLSIEDETISAIRVVRNPDKLAHIERQLETRT